jgi:hypothetical protein
MAWRGYTKTGLGSGAFFLTFAVISALMAYGLWRAKRWARLSQVFLLMPMMVLLPVGFAAMLTIGYMNRSQTRSYFTASGTARGWQDARTFSESEWPWILSIVGTLGLGLFILRSLAPLFRQWG